MVNRSALHCLLGLLLVLLAACARAPEPEILRMGLAAAPVNLDPRFATDATSERINRLLYQRLVDFDEAGQPVPDLADWEQRSPTLYRFSLRGHTVFHHGRPLQAEDVAATYAFILDPANASPHHSALSMVERVEVTDFSHIDFYLSRPDPLFPAYLTAGILPAELIRAGHAFDHQPVGSGPFRFVAWPEEGRLVLERQADGRRFEFLRVQDPTVRVLKLLRGEIDMLQNDLPPELLGYLAVQKGIQLKRRSGTNFTYVGFNLQDTVTGQPLVRQAIAHAIDRQSIIRYVLKEGAEPAQAILPSTHWAGGKELQPYTYDPAQARALLAQAGFDAQQPIKLVYKTSSDPFRIRLATVIQDQLAQVGIEVEIRSYDWGTFYGDIKAGRFQMFSLSWVGINTPDIFRYAFHSTSLPPQGANRGRFSDARVDRLIEQAEEAADPGEQAALYQQLQTLLLEELPYVPLWYEQQVFAGRSDIAGYRLAGDGNYDGLLDVRRL